MGDKMLWASFGIFMLGYLGILYNVIIKTSVYNKLNLFFGIISAVGIILVNFSDKKWLKE